MLNPARFPLRLWLVAGLCVMLFGWGTPSAAQSAMQQALAQVVAKDKTLTAFYSAVGYQPLWISKSNKAKQRMRAFNDALARAGDHALPVADYDLDGLETMAKTARTPVDQAKAEAAYTKAFLAYAQDIQAGVVVPSKTASGIERAAPRHDGVQLLTVFSKSSAKGFMAVLPPQTAEYKRLVEAKARLEKQVSKGWGQPVGATLKPGQTSDHVVLLRKRLAAQGYGRAGNSNVYDSALVSTVQAFQRDHGLAPDGVIGKGTLGEINKDPQDRLVSVMVSMERERWMNINRGKRHIWVNLPDFTAQIIDGGKVTFETRSVIGKNASTHRSPEFSDVMEYLVINPTWNVPQSITVREYLPMMQQNPNAAGHLQLLDRNGRVVSRSSVNFASYDANSFPYILKEPPSQGNALGTVKFMFPNRYNIYLHDTPSKSLFSRETRAFSHGCIRLSDPHEFAYALLAKQTNNPEGVFKGYLNTGRETTVALKSPVPVHIVYRTAFTTPKGPVQYRRDVYGREKAVYSAMQKAGVSLRAVRS